MARNLEIKVKLDSHKSIIKILSANNIKLFEVLKQKDIYYKVKKGLLKLRIENGKQTLIFYNRNEKSKKRWSDYFLLDINSSDANKFLDKFLERIVEVNKIRELYWFDNTRIHLDKVDKLGYFLELETRVINGLRDAEKRFNYLVELLELKKYPELRDTYRNLLIRKMK
ncbi:Class 2 adenylate cyclase [Ignavibacterium album JCM 16511]|uniref:Class 2 adenylate cyclase n=1 Tax=Ignavibacterium album (strain DSM 19864 / JCM 16511 / NBRC 101810 / Mat9-16) TaxID=945713 RepID=I0AM19_IGNAJ|nr:class IV adenylate cyclase [Ignavibacterium album]AFH50026.1 Class 2 adenylate cyclase [Ignavibacterium album JCM 16511]